MRVKKLLFLLPIALLWLLAPTPAPGLQPPEIILTTPISAGQSLNRVRVSNISDHPELQQLSFRLSIGYIDADGTWVEKRDHHDRVENLPAVVDDPATPVDETQAARPRYNQLKALMRTSGKNAEQIILERVLSRFPGTIQ